MHLLAIVAGAFKLWMLVDCAQRCGGSSCNNYWFWIILLPFGDVAYFITIKIHDFPLQNWLALTADSKSAPVSKLRYEAEHCPSTGNKLRLAQGLYMQGEHIESKSIIEEVLFSYPEDKEAMFGYGVVLYELKEYEKSKVPLLKLVTDDLTFRNYEAAKYLLQAYEALGAKQEAYNLSKRLYEKSLALEHAQMYAKSLADNGQVLEARKLLEKSLLEYDNSPKFVKRSQKSFAKASRSFLKQELQ